MAIAALLAGSCLLFPAGAVAQLRGGATPGSSNGAGTTLPVNGPGAVGPRGIVATGTSADAVFLSEPPPAIVGRAAPSRASRPVRNLSSSASTRRSIRLPRQSVSTLPAPVPPAATGRVRTQRTVVSPAADGLQPYPPRPRTPPPEADPYAAPGLRSGGLILRPATNDFVGYDTNPNRSSGRSKGSGFARAEGEFGLQSDWNRHELTGNLRGGYSRFFNLPDASRPDAEGRLGLRLDFDRDTRADLETRLRIDTQRAGSTTLSANAVGRPLTYSYGASAGVTHDINRLQLSLRGSVDRNTYEDGRDSNGATIIQSDRNQTQYGLRLRAGYELSPGIRPFVEGSADTRQFDDKADVNGFRRSSNGYGARIGSTIELTRQLTGEISVGYQQRRFDDGRLRDLRGIVGDAALIWSATPLTTVTLRGTSELTDATIAAVNGATTRRASLEVSHALLRNFTVTPFATFSQTAYDGISLREDTTSYGARLDYRLSRSIAIRASFTQERLKSTAVGADYTANIAQAGLRLQF